ncbi:MAG TPA: hypothetical protein VFV27_00260, partial [Nevskiaceae bacterium]|nr:hypothetical protein [Nevskiaceae bacterium]
PLTMSDLRLASGAHPALQEVSTRNLYEDGQIDGAPAPEAIRKVFDDGGIRASAQFRYQVSDASGKSELRARVDWFVDEARAEPAFRGRHMPEALAVTETLPIGNDAFAYRDEYLGFRVGTVVVEIRAKPAWPGLREFSRVYAGHLGEALARQAPR